jgi:hypothetical protein
MNSTCGYRYELANGETVTPCHLPAGHTGHHEGYCLGSKATWTSDKPHDSEEEQYMEHKMNNPDTMTLTELRDWHMQDEEWTHIPPTSTDYREYWQKGDKVRKTHPYPATLDGAASAMPKGWYWLKDAGSTPNPDGIYIRWVACQRGKDNWKIVEVDDTGDEITDRYRLAMKAKLAEKENKQ